MSKNLHSLKKLAFLSSSLVLLSSTAVCAMDTSLQDQIKNGAIKLKSAKLPHPSQSTNRLPQVDNSFRNAINQRGASMQGKPSMLQQMQANMKGNPAIQVAISKGNAQTQDDTDWTDNNTTQASSSTGGAAGKPIFHPAPARPPVDPKLVQQGTSSNVQRLIQSATVWSALSPVTPPPSAKPQLSANPLVSSPQPTFRAPAPSTPLATSTSPVSQMNQQPNVSVSKVTPTVPPTVDPLESSVELHITRHSPLLKFSLPDKTEVHVNSGNQVWVKTPDQGYPATSWESYASANKFNFRVNVCQGSSDSLELLIPRGSKPFSFFAESEVAVDHASTWVKEKNGPGYYGTPFDKFAQTIGLPNAKATFAEVRSASMQVMIPPQPAPVLNPVTPPPAPTLLLSVSNNTPSSLMGHSPQSASSLSSSADFVPPVSFGSSYVDPNAALQQAQLQNHLAQQPAKQASQPSVSSLAVPLLASHLGYRVETLKKKKVLTEDDVAHLKLFPFGKQSDKIYEIVLKKPDSNLFFATFISRPLQVKVKAAYDSGTLSSNRLYRVAEMPFNQQAVKLDEMLKQQER